MKSTMKRIGCLILAAALTLCAAIPAFASDTAGSYKKDEIIYVNLRHDGQADSIYVVNSFDVTGRGLITDRGSYSEVINLTTTEPIYLKGNMVTVSADTGKFYYEGVLEKQEIPWDISVEYRLNGETVAGEALAGASGLLQIDIGIRQREDAHEIYRDHYAVQAALSLDGENCADINAPDATIASVGDKKQLSYIILPGKDKHFTVTANVRDFELAGISFNMIPLSLSIDDPDTSEIKDKLYELQDGAVELDDGAIELDDGAFDLDDGAKKLDDGAIKLDDGVVLLQDGLTELTDGVDELRDGADDLRDGADDLLSGARKIRNGAKDLDDGATELSSGTNMFAASLAQLNSQSASLTGGSAQIKGGLGQLAQAVSGDDARSAEHLAKALKNSSDGYLQALDGLIGKYEALLDALKNPYPVDYSASGFSIGENHEAGGDSLDAALSGTDSDTEPENDEQDGSVSHAEADAEEPDEDVSDKDDVSLSEETAENTLTEPESRDTDEPLLYRATIQLYSDDDISGQIAAMEQIIADLNQLRNGYIQINYGVAVMADEALPALSDGLDQLAGKYNELDGGIIAYTQGVGQLASGFDELTGGVYSLSDGIEELLDGSKELRDGALELYDGTYDLQDGVRKLSDGTAEFGDGITELKDGAAELRDGTIELLDGTAELKDGTAELRDGTKELREKTADMDQEVDDKIDEILNEYRSSDFMPVSFVDAENTNINAVQFVMKTAEITIEDEAGDIIEQEPELTIWQRFLSLFPFLHQPEAGRTGHDYGRGAA